MPDLRELGARVGEKVCLRVKGKRHTAELIFWQPESDMVYLAPPIDGSAKKLFNLKHEYPIRATSIQDHDRNWIPAPKEVGDIEVMETIATRGDYAREHDIPVRDLFLYKLLNESMVSTIAQGIYHRVARRK